MTFLHLFRSSFQNLIFCKVLLLTPRKEIISQKNISIYRKKTGLLGNYGAL